MFLIKPVYAQCPVCVITVGGGLLIAKKLGIDDLLASIWLSGLNMAIAFWIASTIKKKVWNNSYLWSILFYLISILYLLLTKQIGHPKNTFLGIDKVVFGMSLGFLIFLLSFLVDKIIRRKNYNKVLFPYQKVVVPLIFLLISTLIFKFFLIYVKQ